MFKLNIKPRMHGEKLKCYAKVLDSLGPPQCQKAKHKVHYQIHSLVRFSPTGRPNDPDAVRFSPIDACLRKVFIIYK